MNISLLRKNAVLLKHEKERQFKAEKGSDGPTGRARNAKDRPVNPSNHLTKLLNAHNMDDDSTPATTLIEFLEQQVRLRPETDEEDTLFPPSMQWKHSSKGMACKSVSEILSLDDVKDALFVDNPERLTELIMALEARRCFHQAFGKRLQREKAKAAQEESASSSSESNAGDTCAASDEPTPGDSDEGGATAEPADMYAAPSHDINQTDLADQLNFYKSAHKELEGKLESLHKAHTELQSIVDRCFIIFKRSIRDPSSIHDVLDMLCFKTAHQVLHD